MSSVSTAFKVHYNQQETHPDLVPIESSYMTSYQ